jgi:2'-5' RNA ligase
MHAIVSLLEPSIDARIQALWNELEAECGLKGIRATPIPHFSWHVAEDYEFPALRHILERISLQAKPFSVRTAGLGAFTGVSPVIFIALVRDRSMETLHHKVWQNVRKVAVNLSPYYAPDAWTPHITLAHRDVTSENIGCAQKLLTFKPIEWEIRVDNLAIVYQLGEDVGRLSDRFDFQKTVEQEK